MFLAADRYSQSDHSLMSYYLDCSISVLDYVDTSCQTIRHVCINDVRSEGL